MNRKRKMIKLFLMLVLLAVSKVLTAFCAPYLESYAVSLVVCFFYVLLFALFYEREEHRKKRVNIRKGAITLLFFLCASIFASSLTSLAFSPVPQKVSLLRGVVAVFAVPVFEELFFRATLFKKLSRIIPIPLSVFFSALIFAVCHGTLAAFAVSFVLGILLAVIYNSTHSLLLVTLCHALNNLLAALLIIERNMLITFSVASLLALCTLFPFFKKEILE